MSVGVRVGLSVCLSPPPPRSQNLFLYSKVIKQLIELRNILIHKLMDLKSRRVNKLCNVRGMFWLRSR